jgi:hypothetical protein
MRTEVPLTYKMSSFKSTPHLEKIEKSQQLIVNGKPFLMLGAELQNSSMTSAAYMDTVWQKLVDTNINTVLGCVTWEDIEPVEGKFDFSELDQVIKGARTHGLHLVLLWFGSFKNGILGFPKQECCLMRHRNLNIYSQLGQERYQTLSSSPSPKGWWRYRDWRCRLNFPHRSSRCRHSSIFSSYASCKGS